MTYFAFIGGNEAVLLLIVLLLLFGAGKLPQMARSAGKAAREIKEGVSQATTTKDGITTDVGKLKHEVTKQVGSFRQDLDFRPSKSDNPKKHSDSTRQA